MLSILERLDPDSDRIDLLVDLVDWLRPRRARYLTTILETCRHTSLYADVGILSYDGFFTELKKRIAYRILPPALDYKALHTRMGRRLRAAPLDFFIGPRDLGEAPVPANTRGFK